jgi:hypothetical protein
MEEPQSNIVESAGLSEASSAPVSDTTSANVAPSVSTDEKFGASMEATYDRIERGGNKRQYPEVHSSEEALPSGANPATPAAPLPPSINGRINPDTWAAMPKEAQQLFLEREQEAQAKISQYGREVAELKKAGGTSAELGDVVGRYSAYIPRGQDGQPMPAPAVMEHLLAAHAMLESQPAPALQALAAHYGVNLGALANDPDAAQQQQHLVSQFQQESQRIQQEVAQLRATQQQWQHQRQQYLHREIESLISGKQHWSQIEDECLRQVNAVREQNPSLFEMDPLRVVRDAVERAEKIVGISAKRDIEEAAKKAAEAKRLASLNIKSRAGGKSPSSVSSKDIWSNDAWASAYDRASR